MRGSEGGAEDAGVVFKLNTDPTEYCVLRSFSRSNGDAGYPEGTRLTEGVDVALYGTTLRGGANGQGAVFKLNKDGTGFKLLHRFAGPDGMDPSAALVLSSDGTCHGTSAGGGDMGFGSLFALRPQGLMLPPIVSGAAVLVRCSSMPGSMHRLERASALDGGWLTLSNLVVPSNGVVEFRDSGAPQPNAFYRTVAQ